MNIKVLAVLLLTFSGLGFTCSQDGSTGLLPENTMKIPLGDKSANTLSKREFFQTLEKLEKIYSPIFSEHGLELEVEKKWDDSTVNAYALRKNGKAIVAIFGGLARHFEMTADGVLLAACHEAGHHIGGIPLKVKGPPSINGSRIDKTPWASNEGQSDYFGIMKCFRRIVEGENHQAVLKLVHLDKSMENSCSEKFSEKEDQLICMRAIAAGKAISSLFIDVINAELAKRGKPERLNPVSFDKNDNSVVPTMDDDHPLPQCRLDTFVNGALCDKDISEEVSYTDVDAGICSRREGYTVGVRPLCWFKE